MKLRTAVPRPTSPRGFTLIEIMITLVVIAALAALTAPSMMLMAPNMQLKSTARTLYANLQNAKVTAIKENRSVTVRFDTPGIAYVDLDNTTPPAPPYNPDGNYQIGEPMVLLGEDLNGNGQLDAGEDLNGNGKLDDNYGVAYGTGAAANNWSGVACVQTASITFDNRGIPTAASAIYLDKSNSWRVDDDPNFNKESYAIEITAAGSIQLHRYTGAPPWD